MNRNRDIYVRCVPLQSWTGPYLISIPQGPDVDGFNPDRFIDEHGQLLPALVDTKDGMQFSRP